MTNNGEQQACIESAILPKPLHWETVVSENYFLDDQDFPREVHVGKGSLIQRKQETGEEGLLPLAQISVSFFSILHIALHQQLLQCLIPQHPSPHPSPPFPMSFLTVIMLLQLSLINIVSPTSVPPSSLLPFHPRIAITSLAKSSKSFPPPFLSMSRR